MLPQFVNGLAHTCVQEFYHSSLQESRAESDSVLVDRVTSLTLRQQKNSAPISKAKSAKNSCWAFAQSVTRTMHSLLIRYFPSALPLGVGKCADLSVKVPIRIHRTGIDRRKCENCFLFLVP